MYTPTYSPNYSPMSGLRASRLTSIETAAESPYQVRSKSIGKRLAASKTSIVEPQSDYKAKTEQLELKIRQIDERITNNHNYTEDKLQKFTDDILRVEENIAAEIIARELLEERTVKEMKLVESNLALELKNENEQNKESERKILSKVDEKVHSMRASFFEEQKKLNQVKEEQKILICEQVNELQKGLKDAQAAREQVHNTIIQSISTRINKIQDNLNTERKIRNETESFLFRKIEEIFSNLENQVAVENEKRERTESQMLRLLEEACNKFEGHVSSYRSK